MPSGVELNAYWFVRAMFDDEDQTQTFIQDGIWEIRNPTDNELELIKSMKPSVAPTTLIHIKRSRVFPCRST